MNHFSYFRTLSISICLLGFMIMTFACTDTDAGLKSDAPSQHSELRIEHDENAGTISVFRAGEQEAILTQNAREDLRPYVYPIVAPDGKGVLTENSPGHHTHQTGLYWGFTRVNDRDFFHNPGGDYWQRVSAGIIVEQVQGGAYGSSQPQP